jgi:hypothetical protein
MIPSSLHWLETKEDNGFQYLVAPFGHQVLADRSSEILGFAFNVGNIKRRLVYHSICVGWEEKVLHVGSTVDENIT